MASYCDIDNYPEFYSESGHKTTKPRKCCECGGAIDPGEKYVSCRAKWVKSGFRTFTQCATCYHVCRALNNLQGECVVAFGSLEDWVFDSENWDAGWCKLAPVFQSIFPPLSEHVGEFGNTSASNALAGSLSIAKAEAERLSREYSRCSL